MFPAKLFDYEYGDRKLQIHAHDTSSDGSASVFCVTVVVFDLTEEIDESYTQHSIENVSPDELAELTVIASMAVSVVSLVGKWLQKMDACDIWAFAQDVVEDDVHAACEDWRISFGEMMPALQPSLDGYQDYLLGNMLYEGDFTDWFRKGIVEIQGFTGALIPAFPLGWSR